MKFQNLSITNKEAKKLGLKIWTTAWIYQQLKRIQESNMAKHGVSYTFEAVGRDMQKRCIIGFEDKKALVFEKRFKKMLKEYASGKIYAPHNFSVEEFNHVAKIMLFSSEC